MKTYHQRFKSPLERFFECVQRTVGCWEWTAGVDKRGPPFLPYGKFWLDKKPMAAHRASWIFSMGPIPSDYKVLHRCDNPRCVRPSHLFIGTPVDNTRDMMAKGRDLPTRVANIGERSPKAKLTESDVRDILASNHIQRVLAARHGVSQTAISRIKLRRNWKHVDV